MTTNAVFVEAMGLALVQLGDNLAATKRHLAGHPVRLVRDHSADLLRQFPELAAALACAEVVNAAGGELLTANAGHCVIGHGCAGESVTAEVEGVHLPLCWHHDNERHDGQLPISLSAASEWVARVVLQKVAGWCGERVLLEVADEIAVLGHTDCQRGAGHWLVLDTTPEQVAEEVERLRGAPVLVLRGCVANGAVDNSGGEALANP